MPANAPRFIPAAGRHWHLPFYDMVARLLGASAARRALVDRMHVIAGTSVLDVGAGTGELTLEVKRRFLGATVVGVDPDPAALRRARAKAENEGLRIDFHEAFAQSLPFDDGLLDHVVSSFMLHHLDVDTKVRAVAEMRRVLAPGGTLHLLEFDGAPSVHSGFIARRLHASWRLGETTAARMLRLLAAAGFTDVRVIHRQPHWLAPMCCFEARAPVRDRRSPA